MTTIRTVTDKAEAIAVVDAHLAGAGLSTYSELREALKDEHKACDWLMARLIEADNKFRPTKSPIWESIVNGSEVIAKSEAK